MDLDLANLILDDPIIPADPPADHPTPEGSCIEKPRSDDTDSKIPKPLDGTDVQKLSLDDTDTEKQKPSNDSETDTQALERSNTEKPTPEVSVTEKPTPGRSETEQPTPEGSVKNKPAPEGSETEQPAPEGIDIDDGMSREASTQVAMVGLCSILFVEYKNVMKSNVFAQSSSIE